MKHVPVDGVVRTQSKCERRTRKNVTGTEKVSQKDQ